MHCVTETASDGRTERLVTVPRGRRMSNSRTPFDAAKSIEHLLKRSAAKTYWFSPIVSQCCCANRVPPTPRCLFECSLFIRFNITLFLIFVNYRAVCEERLQPLRSALKQSLMDHDHARRRAMSSDFHSIIVRSVV